jgi:ABC-type glutathione transport system ATPase component
MPSQGITALFGHSGSGKTTLLRAIAGLERVPDGQPFRRCPGPDPRPAGVGADQGRGPDRMRKHFLSNPEMSLKGGGKPRVQAHLSLDKASD